MGDTSDLGKLLASSDIREIFPLVERARILIDQHEQKTKNVLVALDVTPSQLKRARKSFRAGRVVGRVGRPRLLSDGQEAELVLKIKEAVDIAQPMTITQTLELVSSSFVCFACNLVGNHSTH